VDRCYKVSRAFLKFLTGQEGLERKRDYSLTWERIHSLGSARTGAILSARRGIDIELGYTAGVLHDFGRIVTGKHEDHAVNGYQPVREFLEGLKLFREDEIKAISLAVKHHSRKDLVGSPLDEIAKDCDILDTHLLGIRLRTERHYQRLAEIQKELNLKT
jgi:uncharacterized protein